MRVHVHGCDMQCVARGGCCHVRFFLARSCWIVAGTEQRAYHNVFLFIASHSHRHNHTYKMIINENTHAYTRSPTGVDIFAKSSVVSGLWEGLCCVW